MSNKNLVYSTETGRHCPTCGQPVNACVCAFGTFSGKKKTKTLNKIESGPSDGIIRLQRQVKGRNGKTVTLITGITGITGLEPDPIHLKKLAKEFKAHCGTGGSIEGNNILIQGDQRNRLKELLEKKGYKVKLSGG